MPALLFVLFPLIAPRGLKNLSPAALIRLPLEGLLCTVLVLVLPARARRAVVVLAGVLLGLLTILKMLDIGFSSVLARPFDPVGDWTLLGNGVEFLTASVGKAGAIGAVIVIAALTLTVPVLMTLSVRRLTRLAAGNAHPVLRGVAVLSVAWVVCAVVGVQVAPDLPVAATAYDRVLEIPESLRDQKAFARAAAADPFRDTPGDRLLTALRGKDVVFAFVESYGRSAVEDPFLGSRVDPVLDGGTRRLAAAGFSSRSAWLTSPTAGGGSWLAHGTLMSGLWVDNQLRYGKLVKSDRLTLNRLFQRAGWRSVALAPGVTRSWPEAAYYGFDRLYDRWNLGYRGPRFNWGMPPDQYTLSFLRNAELARPRGAPVMVEMPLVTSHAPWAPTPRMVGWGQVGDGSVFTGMPPARRLRDSKWNDARWVRTSYRGAVEYTLSALIGFVETYGDDDLVLVFLGDHQPAPIVTDGSENRDVPISIVTRDQAVIGRISGWGWQDGLKPGRRAPVWRMNAFRDRFVTTFGP